MSGAAKKTPAPSLSNMDRHPMDQLCTRRTFGLGVGAACMIGFAPRGMEAHAEEAVEMPASRFREIEDRSGGRLGVSVIDTGNGRTSGYRTLERFPLCSTFKLLASAAVLKLVDRRSLDLDKRIRYTAQEVVANSPVLKDHAGGEGVSLAQACEAAITRSDNTAGNMLLRELGGPAALTRFLRSLGDRETRLDRIEPELNEALPGDPRDTTTPSAMASDIRSLAFGNTLSSRSKAQLLSWLRANTTGAERLRAGLADDWDIGDKTGAGERGSTNDVGIVWPPSRPPFILCVYLTNTTAPVEIRNRAIADVARAVFPVR